MGMAEALAGAGGCSDLKGLLAVDQSVLDAIPAAVAVWSADGVLVRFNREAIGLWGRTPRPGDTEERLYRIDAAARSRTGTPLEIALRTGEPQRNTDATIERPDGSRSMVLVNIEVLKSADGCIQGAISCAHDITRRRQAAEDSHAKRVKELGALYRFTARLHRTQSLPEVYEAALDAIVEALQCTRASILLFDDAGAMRYVAWRGLSDGYRNALEGLVPWLPDQKDPEPILIGDIDASRISNELRSIVKAEGIRALALIPLVVNGRLIGKFIAYYDAPHVLSGHESELALTTARQLAFGIERKRAEQALRQNEERLRLATQSGKVGLWEWDIRANRVSWTDSIFAIHGVSKREFSLTVEGFASLVHPEDHAFVMEALDRSLRDDVPYELEFRAVRPDGQVIWLFANGIVLRDGKEPLRLLGAVFDITERKAVEAQRDLLVAELSHRVKNTLATVISIAQQTFLRGASAEESRRSFDARIRALAQTHGRLAEANWSGVSLECLVLDETAPYRREDDGNVRLSGPSIFLNPKHAVTLGMALHELSTNAAKYGALSSKRGAVDIVWHIAPEAEELRIRWIESGGPAVVPPERSGFGRLLLERALASDLRGTVQLDFAEAGVQCAIAFPLSKQAAGFA